MTKILVVFFLLVFSCSPVLALDEASKAAQIDIGYSKISPVSFFYFLKTIREDLELKFALTPRVKLLRQLEFATRRLREVRTVVSLNQNLIPPTLERYNYYLNTMPDKDLNDEEVLARIKGTLITHLEVLQQMYGSVSSLRAKMAIRSAMNRVIQRADVPKIAKAPVCAFFSKEASSSSLNQTEKVVLADRSQKCFQGLSGSN